MQTTNINKRLKSVYINPIFGRTDEQTDGFGGVKYSKSQI